MKRIAIFLLALILVGQGCAQNSSSRTRANVPDSWSQYTNQELGFEFYYPPSTAVQERDAQNRPNANFAGIEGLVIASLQEISRSENAETYAFVYLLEDTDLDALRAATNAQGEGFEITGEEAFMQAGLNVIAITNMTPIGREKTTYVLDVPEGLIVFSVFLGEQETFEEVLGTLGSAS